MNTQQALITTTYAINHGWIKPSTHHLSDDQVKAIKEEQRIAKIRANQKVRRQRNLDLGLTKDGHPRKRAVRLDLTGWTPEAKRARQLEQQKAWNLANRDWRNL